MYTIKTITIVNELMEENYTALGRTYRPDRWKVLEKNGTPVEGLGPWRSDAKVTITRPNKINPTHGVDVQVWVNGRYCMPETFLLPD